MEGHSDVQSTSKGCDESIDQIPTHFLVELTSLDELAFPANSTKRVKYTCVASTSKSLCLGTSTGSVYIFSRYAAKSRSRASSPIPVQVFTTRDGLISTISCSPSEELMAIGGESGRVSIAQLNNGQPPTLLYSTPGDARSPDRVTALAWSSDLKTVYSGHASGSLHCHRLSNRSVFFRTAHQKLYKFDSEIVQIDTLQQHVLVATSLSAHLVHVESGSVQQVGKKTRATSSALGARYIQPDGNGESAFIVAARPNGRLWEANLVGVVYRTHQYRQSTQIPRAPPISFRGSFPTDSSQFSGLHPDNQDVSLKTIHVIRLEDSKGSSRLFIVSACGPRICVVELETSRVICVSELEHDILDVATSSNDVFVLLADSKGLRKFSVFERQKAVEKLNSKNFFLQSAQTVLFCSPLVQFPSPLITQTIEGLATMSRKKETERLQGSLQSIIDDRKASESMYDNMADERTKKESEGTSKKLSSGIHRVLHTGHCSGYDDDFSFCTPQALRERSRSSPCGPETPPTSIEKRASEPLSLELRWRENGTPDVVEEDILHRARQILEEATENSQKLVEIESLRTLLQLEGVKRDEIRFTPTVTIGNAAKALAELALAVPVDVSTIWNKSEVNVEEKSSKKPTIVKVVRPGIRPVEKKKPVATVSPRSHEDDVAEAKAGELEDVAVNNSEIPDEMRRKQDEMWLDLRLSHIKKQSHASPSETVPKSDTDYTLTTESEGPTPSGTSDVIWTNPLEEEDIVTPTRDSFNCDTCQMHRSWATTALLMAVSRRGEVLRDEFRTHGAIPSTVADWGALLRHMASRRSELDLTAICPRCEMSLSTVERVCHEAWRLTSGGMVEDGVKPNCERIYERCMNSSKEKLKDIVSRSPEPEHRTFEQGLEEKEQCSETKESSRKDEEVSETSEISKVFESPNLRFLAAIPLKTILSLAVYTIGKQSVLQIISSDHQFIAKRLDPADWSAIVVMGAREVLFKDLLASKTILSVLESVEASGWVVPRKAQTVPTTSRKMSPTNTISSWIVDSNGKCPLCSLPVKMIVGGTDRGILSYQCGHCYHKMCLDGRHTIGCIACRIRARRAANSVRNGSSATSSPTSSPLMSPRQQRLC